MADQRTTEVVDDLVRAVRDVIRDRQVVYDEFHAAVDYLIRLGRSGEIPLLMAVLFEATVDDVTHRAGDGSTTTIEGPFYKPGAPVLQRPYRLPRRVDEPGDLLLFSGTVCDKEGRGVAGAELDMWQADGETPGEYSNVHAGIPDWNLRGRFHTDDRGAFEVETVLPAPYEIRKGGPTEELLSLVGRHTWRPSHLHLKVGHPDFESLTTQLFFAGGEYLDSDAGNAVKGDLIIPFTETPRSSETAGARRQLACSYGFVLGRRP